MKIGAIIQARMGSTRLPGKVLLDIGGKSMLERTIRRVQLAKSLTDVVVATSTEHADDAIEAECRRLGVDVFRGSEDDVLDRYYRAALSFGLDVIVRITADCPLIDPEVIDFVITRYLDVKPDYASNIIERTYPRGLDTEVFSFYTLETIWKEAHQEYQRVHVTPFVYQNPTRFNLLIVKDDQDNSRYRWTVDTQKDLNLIRKIYQNLGDQESFSWQEILSVLSQNPELVLINTSVTQKPLELG